MFTKYKIIFFLVLLFSFLTFLNNVSASTTNGTIDSTYHYAWGENVGWVDFTKIQITDSALSGSIYGENIGWIDLSTVTNTSAGILSGYAWGENVGFIDFSKVAIGTDGVFTGGAYGENIGWITFGTGDNKVATDWRPLSVRSVAHISSGGYLPGYGPNVTPPPAIPLALGNAICNMGDKFSKITGLPCTSFLPASPSCTITVTLKQGSKGVQVKCLQTILKNLSTDGIFGKLTKASVVVFQKANKLTPDGIVGPITRAKLNIIK